MVKKERKLSEQIYSNLDYKFKNKKLLIKSLTHSSYSNENKKYNIGNNERLEFLGDSILSLIVSKFIFTQYTEYPEGELTKLRAKVVCEEILSKAARKLDIGNHLFLGKGEEQTGGRERKSILADTFEAIIAAIYLDGGFACAQKFVLSNLKVYIELAVKGKIVLDYKSHLQEYYQSKEELYKIKYIVEKEEGPDHSKVFYVSAYVNKEIIGRGIGKSKKIAEQSAAKNALNKIGELNG